MLNRLKLVVALGALIGAPRMAGADPITYDFAGTLTEPFDGSKTFNGTLTVNGTPPSSAGQPGVVEDGSGVSFSVNFGGQVLNFANSPQNPLVFATFMVSTASVEYGQPQGPPEMEFSFNGSNGAAVPGTTITFGLTLYSLGVGSLPANLASLPLPLGTSSVDLTEVSGTGAGSFVGFAANLTSIEVVSTPEPSTMSVLLGLGIAALVHRRFSGSRRKG